VLLSAGLGSDPRYGDHTLSSHEPHDLLTLMRDTFGDPRVSREERRLA
jgi:hypothetical protein